MNMFMENAQNYINGVWGKYKFVNPNYMYDKTIIVTFEGCSPFELTYQDLCLEKVLSLCQTCWKGIKKNYGKEYQFFLPQVILKPEGIVSLQVNMIDKSILKQLTEQKKYKKIPELSVNVFE